MKKLLMLLSCMLVSSAFAAPSGASAVDHVRLRLHFKVPIPEYAIYTIGMKKGFYKESNIELELLPTNGAAMGFQLIGAGEYDFATGSAEAALTARSRGIPLRVVAVRDQRPMGSIFSLASNKIRTLKDLEGKSLASDPAGVHLQLLAVAKIHGLDLARVRILPHPGSNMELIVAGKADAIVVPAFRGRAFFQRTKIEGSEINFAEQGLKGYGNSLVASERIIKSNPDLVRRFVKATMKSWTYAKEHPREAFDSYMERYPDQDRKDPNEIGILFEFMTSDQTEKNGIGYQTKDLWKEVQEHALQSGLIKSKLKLEDVFTVEFLK